MTGQLRIGDVLNRLRGVRRVGKNGNYKALCPAHLDRNPSLSVTLRDGKILLKCMAGCQTEAVVKRLGLSMSDLFLDAKSQDTRRRLVCSYSYPDESGKLLYEVCRYQPKAFAQRRPDSEGGYAWNLQGIKPILYRLPELIEAMNAGRTVYIPEGEKDVDALCKLGLSATCNSGGAGKWRDSYSNTLEGGSVVIIADKDVTGRSHAQAVAQSLNGKTKNLKVLELPDRDGHRVKDTSDWLAAGGVLEELEWLANKAPCYKTSSQETGFHLTKLSDLLQEPDEDIAYLWENTLIKGGLSILVAKPKVGKSTLARNLALKIAKGDTEFLGRAIIAFGPVVYLALEEKRSEVKKHFERMGATEDLPIFVHVGSAPEKVMEELRKAVMESQAVLAIVDPMQRLLRSPDLNDYSSVSLALEPLIQIARDSSCHIVLIHHANKGLARESGDSILGSTAIFGSVDCALIMKRNESYRTIESIQRYGEDLPRTVLTFDAGMGLTSSGGSLEDVELAKCGDAILTLLVDNEMVEAEIKESITDHKGGIVSKSLRLLYQARKIQRKGQGKKGDPYLYATGNAGDSRDIYIPIPTIPTIPTNGFSLNNPLEGQEYVWEKRGKEIPSILCKTDDTLDIPELGIPVEKAIEIWRSHGAPVIHLGQGENCHDLKKLLSNSNVNEHQLIAVRVWLDKVDNKRR